MMTTPTRRFLSSLFVTAALSVTSVTSATAQPTSTESPRPPIVSEDSGLVREQLMAVLEAFPPEVGSVLKLDPALLNNHEYLSTYPALATFVAGHPQLAHNPEFFLQGVSVHTAQVPDPPGIRIMDRLFSELIPFAVFLVISGIVVWLIRTTIEQRRWTRASQAQTDMFTKLFDRFGSNEELIAYLQSGTGRRILESLPIDPAMRAGSPLNRILWTVQVGIVTTIMGLGMQIVSWRVPVEVATPLSAMAIIVLSIGIGFVLSAVVSHVMSRRLGVLPPAQVQE